MMEITAMGDRYRTFVEDGRLRYEMFGEAILFDERVPVFLRVYNLVGLALAIMREKR